MATIEPRLIHLLNDSSTPQLPHADLPALQALSQARSADRPSPLEPDTSQRSAEKALKGQVGAALPLYSLPDDGASGGPQRGESSPAGDQRVVGAASAYPLRLLLDGGDAPESSNSLSRILDNSETPDDIATKKRQRAITVKDDFVQLPQPVKKQKAAQQQPVMPPIINGLHEPPPDAALFPPISSTKFDESDAKQVNILREYANSQGDERPTQHTPAETDKTSMSKVRKKAAKPRRKWSEEETNHLLLGVNRHGVGKWTNILEDPDFRFNDRTAGDLKDRFRTCCPDELRNRGGRNQQPESPKTPAPEPKPKAKTGLLSENILIEENGGSPGPQEPLKPSPQHDSDSGPKTKKSRAHRKKMEDLAELGIHGPFKKSHRRERRPFTEQDDREILEGLEQYGPAWTKIQRDSRFHLSSRQPTDLRDRVRNKYPNIYQRIEKGTFQVKEGGRTDLLEPSVNMAIENTLRTTKSMPLEPHLSMGSKDEMSKWSRQTLESSDAAVAQAFEFGDTSAVPLANNASDMDISRLLLDDRSLVP